MRSAVIIAVIVIGVISSISLYLAPDDLSGCGDAPSDKCQKADAIIAISGGDTAARTKEAIELYENGWADTLVLSGAALDKTGPSNAAAMREIALEAGVPEEDILIEEVSETTKQNAEQAQSILQDKGVKSIILVTSGYHQRRAGLEFQQRLGEEIEIRNNPVDKDRQWSNTWWLTFEGWYLAVSELGKIIAFYFGGSR